MEIFKHLFWKKEKFMPTYFSVDHFYSYKTYSGCYEGAPPVKSMMVGIRDEVKKMWGTRATYIVEPTIRTRQNPWEDKLDEYLPRWTHMAWVNSSAMSSWAHGSELVIVWFTEEPVVAIDDVIAKVDWEKHATDFEI